ncbi:hypothetical protein M3Y94_00387300 [Aphelenchoides besseyi]|nr:hypothetical protein M3Y94_00387300 [Aphelenchoides besseyi]KAI6235031.1 hypothetical protein M3Y95_00008400 [Aphelenchoides besseyi]
MEPCGYTPSVNHRLPGVKVPSNKLENRALKAGHEEDDNEDIAYLNFRLIWPVALTTALSVLFLAIAIGTMEALPHVAFERFALNQLFYMYGKFRGFCNNTIPYEEGMYPSILRQVEMKVLTNIFFRVAVCVPMAVRIFVALVIRNNVRMDEFTMRHDVFRIFNEIAGVAAIIEVLSLGLFAIVTIRFDFPELYRLAFNCFIICVTIYMYMRTLLSLVPQSNEFLDNISLIVKFLCTLSFSWTASKFYETHQAFINDPGCHGYVSQKDAVTEYIALGSYFIFHLTQLIDIRDIRFICYPRTCSGECEPLKPENFQPNGKYEHCRAFELRQRQLMGLS